MIYVGVQSKVRTRLRFVRPPQLLHPLHQVVTLYSVIAPLLLFVFTSSRG